MTKSRIDAQSQHSSAKFQVAFQQDWYTLTRVVQLRHDLGKMPHVSTAPTQDVVLGIGQGDAQGVSGFDVSAEILVKT
jgi:hypothetical protein